MKNTKITEGEVDYEATSQLRCQRGEEGVEKGELLLLLAGRGRTAIATNLESFLSVLVSPTSLVTEL